MTVSSTNQFMVISGFVSELFVGIGQIRTGVMYCNIEKTKFDFAMSRTALNFTHSCIDQRSAILIAAQDSDESKMDKIEFSGDIGGHTGLNYTTNSNSLDTVPLSQKLE